MEGAVLVVGLSVSLTVGLEASGRRRQLAGSQCPLYGPKSPTAQRRAGRSGNLGKPPWPCRSRASFRKCSWILSRWVDHS